jgi:hypothetical protein
MALHGPPFSCLKFSSLLAVSHQIPLSTAYWGLFLIFSSLKGLNLKIIQTPNMILRFSLKSPMFFHWQTVLHDPPIEEIWSFREPPQGRRNATWKPMTRVQEGFYQKNWDLTNRSDREDFTQNHEDWNCKKLDSTQNPAKFTNQNWAINNQHNYGFEHNCGFEQSTSWDWKQWLGFSQQKNGINIHNN